MSFVISFVLKLKGLTEIDCELCLSFVITGVYGGTRTWKEKRNRFGDR